MSDKDDQIRVELLRAATVEVAGQTLTRGDVAHIPAEAYTRHAGWYERVTDTDLARRALEGGYEDRVSALAEIEGLPDDRGDEAVTARLEEIADVQA